MNSAENIYDSRNEDIYGTSEIIFGTKTGFRRAAVNVSRNYFYWDSGKSFEINMNNYTNKSYASFKKTINIKDSTMLLDTKIKSKDFIKY